MPQRTRAQRLNGLFPLSYMGVVPVSPVNFVIDNRPPTVNDYKNFYVGDLWLDVDTNNPPTNEDIWMLVSVASNVATWINFGGGDTETLSGDSGVNPVFPDGADNINVFGDNVAGITVSGDGVNTLTVTTTGILAHDYVTDNGTAIPAAGILNVITNQAGNNAGATFQFSGAGNTVTLNTTDSADNTFIGENAGNLTLTTASQNSGFGSTCLASISTGDDNFAAGFQSASSLQTGSRNISIGTQSSNLLINGNDNLNIGHQAGVQNTTANINIGSLAGTAITGNSNVHIGYHAAAGGAGGGNASRNCCIGYEAGNVLDNNSDDNVLIGYQAAPTLTGSDSVLIGSGVAPSITTGGSNVIIGAGSGSAYTGAESNNILLTNTGVVADSAAIRIGTFATQTTNFQAGIAGVSITEANREFVTIDNTDGQLGSTDFSALSWTPGLSFGGATTGITYLVQEGQYQTLGNLVFFSGGVALTSKGSATGAARITGLPFNSSGTATVYQGYMAISSITLPAGRTYCWGLIETGTNTIRFNTGGSGVTNALLDDTNFANNSELTCTGFYFRN